MTKQKIIFQKYTDHFVDDVNDHLAVGWRVVPGTIAFKDNCYICVVEKEEPKTEHSTTAPMA